LSEADSAQFGTAAQQHCRPSKLRITRPLGLSLETRTVQKMSDQFSSSKPNKKNDQHKAKAYAAFASSFAPLALDELVAEPPVDGARLNSVEGLAWVWLVNSGGGATSHIGAADKALAGIDGVGDVVDWLHKVSACSYQSSALSPSQTFPSLTAAPARLPDLRPRRLHLPSRRPRRSPNPPRGPASVHLAWRAVRRVRPPSVRRRHPGQARDGHARAGRGGEYQALV